MLVNNIYIYIEVNVVIALLEAKWRGNQNWTFMMDFEV
jgi:hypothetical protein